MGDTEEALEAPEEEVTVHMQGEDGKTACGIDYREQSVALTDDADAVTCSDCKGA